MMRDICFSGNFSLRYKTYICDHNYTTHDIEIVKWYEDSKKYCFTVASWNDDKELVSCESRLIDEIENMDDLEALKELVTIGYAILRTEKRNIELIDLDR